MSTLLPVQASRTIPASDVRHRNRGGGLGFGLFLLLNFLLLVRPQELLPQLNGLHVYEAGMIACLLACGPGILAQFTWRRLCRTPITVCVLGLVPVITLSSLWQSRGDMLEMYALEYAKIALYYLVLVAAIDSPQGLRRFCLALPTIIALIGATAVLDHHGIIHLETLKKLTDVRTDAVTGGSVRFDRLQSVGIFQDPNDLAQILGVGVILCVYGLERGPKLAMKGFWSAAMLLMLYGVYLTQSRGGLLGLVAGLGVLCGARFGARKAVIAAVIALAPLLYLFAGRQTELSTNEGSAQARVQLWSDALQALRGDPVFGLGPGAMMEQSGQVAHNSFLHAYAECGVVGGLLFFTAYYVAILGVLRLRWRQVQVLDPDLAKLTPTLAAALVCYGVGMLSLTRNYVIPTYLMLGLATVFLSLVQTSPVLPQPRFGPRLLGRTFAWSVVFLLAVQLFVRAAVRWG